MLAKCGRGRKSKKEFNYMTVHQKWIFTSITSIWFHFLFVFSTIEIMMLLTHFFPIDDFICYFATNISINKIKKRGNVELFFGLFPLFTFSIPFFALLVFAKFTGKTIKIWIRISQWSFIMMIYTEKFIKHLLIVLFRPVHRITQNTVLYNFCRVLCAP